MINFLHVVRSDSGREYSNHTQCREIVVALAGQVLVIRCIHRQISNNHPLASRNVCQIRMFAQKQL